MFMCSSNSSVGGHNLSPFSKLRIQQEDKFKSIWWTKSRAWEVNFCRTFILSIALSLELADSNLTQTLLNPSKFIWHCLFLLNVSVVLVNTEKCSAQNRVVFIKP